MEIEWVKKENKIILVDEEWGTGTIFNVHRVTSYECYTHTLRDATGKMIAILQGTLDVKQEP